jgi:hypothetical protein
MLQYFLEQSCHDFYRHISKCTRATFEKYLYHWNRKIFLWNILYVYYSTIVTLTLEVGVCLLCTTLCLDIVNISAKYFQNPLMDEKGIDQTRHILSNKHCWSSKTKCVFDLGNRGMDVTHDTSSYYINKYLCKAVSNSFDEWLRYGPDTKDLSEMDGQTDWHKTEPISRFPFYPVKWRGTITA